MSMNETMSRIMMGAVLPGNSTVELKEFPIPEPGYGQVLIKTKSSTICGSDIRAIYREHVGKGPEGYQNKIAGHEPGWVSPDRSITAERSLTFEHSAGKPEIKLWLRSRRNQRSTLEGQ